MDQGTLELLKLLQSTAGQPGDDSLGRIETLLTAQRPLLARAGDLATLAEISELLEEWAAVATAGEAASRALTQAAIVAEAELEQAERAIALLKQALDKQPGHGPALKRLGRLLRGRGDHDLLESVLTVQAQALSGADADPSVAATIHRMLGQLWSEQGELDRAVHAFETALDLEPEADVIEQLADVYALRGDEGDEAQAADLYCALGDVLGGLDSAVWLERALDLVPDHIDAMDGLEAAVPEEEHGRRLRKRWAAFVARREEPEHVDARRVALSRLHAAEGDYREALLLVAPVAERGDSVARALREAYLGNLEGEHDEGRGRNVPAPADAPVKLLPTRRGDTVVGFKLPEEMARKLGRVDIAGLAPVAAPEPVAAAPAAPAPAPVAAVPAMAKAGSTPPSSLGAAVAAPSAPPPASLPAAALAAAPTMPAVSAVSPSLPPVSIPSPTPNSVDDELGELRGRRLPLPSPALLRDRRVWAGAGVAVLLVVGLIAFGGDSTAPAVAASTASSAGEDGDADGANSAAAKSKTGASAATATPAKTAKSKTPPRKARAGSGPSVKALSGLTQVRGGKLARGKVLSAVGQKLGALERCYKQALGRNKKLEGRLVMGFTVKPNGRAAAVRKLRGTIKDEKLVSCSVGHLQNLRFPKPKGRAARVTLPLVFRQG